MARSRRPTRRLKGRALVVTEGQVTEPMYLELLMQELRTRALATVTVKAVGVGKDPEKVVQEAWRRMQEADRQGRPYDWGCCLVDVDRHATLEPALESARRLGLGVIVSNPKFEVWLMWHVDDRRGEVTSGDLDRRVAKAGLVDGKRLRPTFPIADYAVADRVARQADSALASGRRGPNPSTAMPALLEVISGRRGTA